MKCNCVLRVRLTKHRDKLFTFLKYDGVPWNNNAEYAIKQFAYYRENTVGRMKETGLSNYVVLLSLCQTCRYKGVSFLQFLPSKERDVNTFCQRRQRRRRHASSKRSARLNSGLRIRLLRNRLPNRSLLSSSRSRLDPHRELPRTPTCTV